MHIATQTTQTKHEHKEATKDKSTFRNEAAAKTLDLRTLRLTRTM